MMRYLTAYHPRFARSLVYMLQASEYHLPDYLAWFHRAPDFRQVENRGHLVLTAKARLLCLIALMLVVLEGGGVAWLAWCGLGLGEPLCLVAAMALLLIAPLITAYGLAVPLWLGEQFVQKPRAKSIIAQASRTLESHPAIRIAIAGSYGKTTCKEILAAVLSAGKIVAATPGNMNTPLGISRFTTRLTGQEEVLILELGEYYPGDIAELCELTKPHIGVLTGINEAHLSKFKTLKRTTDTIFELADYLEQGPAYKNGENQLVSERAGTEDPLLYSRTGVNGWKVSGVEISLDHTAFTAKRGRVTVHAKSGLLGEHNVGPLVAAIDIADRLGLSPAQIEQGLAATKPYEHRFQPRTVAGAWIVDDTYNGNIDGVRAGLAWLAAMSAKRRIYVTPGLVEQGSRTGEIHQEIGQQLASSLTQPEDLVVLMRNSTTPYIQQGLKAGGYVGQLQIIDNPVKFYTNLDQFVATGDVVLMQNDWTDNFA